jgi:hypothetical protein
MALLSLVCNFFVHLIYIRIFFSVNMASLWISVHNFRYLLLGENKANFFFFFFWVVLGLELKAYTLSHSTSPIFCEGFFQGRVSQNYLPGLLWTVILLICASWVARITGMSHWHLAHNFFKVLRVAYIDTFQLFNCSYFKIEFFL